MTNQSVNITGRILILAAFCACAYLVFFNAFAYYSGWGKSNIVSLDLSRLSFLSEKQNLDLEEQNLDLRRLSFLREYQLKVGGPGIHIKKVRRYRTPEGSEIAVFQTGDGAENGLFIRGKGKIQHHADFEEITTFEPFVAWSYFLKRGAVLFILWLMVLAVAGLVLKLMSLKKRKRRAH